jgi:hypothetical protein
MRGKYTGGYNLFADGRRAWMFQASDEAGWNFEKLFADPCSVNPEAGRQMCGDGWVKSAPSRKRIRDEFQPGHLMFLYQAAPKKAVVGLARLASHGYAQRRNRVAQGKGTYFDLDWWMSTAPLSFDAFKSDPVLAGMEKARIAQGTISRVSEAEARRLLEVLSLDAEQWAAVKREWRFPAQRSGKLPKGVGSATPTLKRGGDGGREDDPEVRRAIEARSMHVVQEHYKTLGYKVEVTASTHPFDLRCRWGSKEVRVEVKGTRGEGGTIELTVGEVENARGEAWRTDLAIVSGIVLRVQRGMPVGFGGQLRILESWSPRLGDLTPTRFRYVVPQERKASK